MIRYSISFDHGTQMDLSAGISASVLPLMSQAVKAISQATASNWKDTVYRAKLWSGEKDAYAQSIKWEMTGNFNAVVSTDYKHAYDIENGRPQRDLKKMLDTSQKVRRTESGKRFLVIPMRHNTPGNTAHAKDMPQSVYGMAKALTPSSVAAVGQRQSGEVTHLSPKTGVHPSANQTPYLSNPTTKQALTVSRNQYAWGGRISAAMLKQAGMNPVETKRYAGMVKMDTSTPGSKSSSYMTFRVMMEGSKGWIVPAQPGLYLARGVARAMQPKAAQVFAAAIQKTVSGS